MIAAVRAQRPEPATPRERPIIFSTRMVWAILEGSKVQTRRVIRVARVKHPITWIGWSDHDGGGWYAQDVTRPLDDAPQLDGETRLRCPYGAVGDRLWVREAFVQNYFGDTTISPSRHAYRANWTGAAADVCPEPKWTPSIHMPRRAARITLEITDVRVQRLQDISEADARAEGVGACGPGGTCRCNSSRFAELWNEINGTPGRRWTDNPWVWCLSFRRVETP